jgi:glutaredoxin
MVPEKNQKRKSRMQPLVKMYTLSTCSHCKSAKTFLNDCALKYKFTDVDMLTGEERATIIEDLKRSNPYCSFPTIIIGDKVIVGFNEKAIREALGL